MANKPLILAPPERRELKRRLRSRALRAEDARRARVILERVQGRSVRDTATLLACSTSYVQRWTKRFRASRLSGLAAQHAGRKAAKGAARLEGRILEWTRRGPEDGSTHWSSRRLARKLGTSHMMVARAQGVKANVLFLIGKRVVVQPEALVAFRQLFVGEGPESFTFLALVA